MENVFFEHFKSLDALNDALETRPKNKVFSGTTGHSNKTDREYNDFSGSASYKEASDLLKNGYKEPLADIQRQLLKLDRQTASTRPRPFNNIVGYAPHVPNALQNIPTSMIDREKRAIKTKTIHLLYGFSALGDVSARDLIKGGTNFIGLVNSLEKGGYRVKVDIMRCTTSSQATAIGYTCNLKEYNQPLNLLKLCYPLVHPSMLRRTSFRWCETVPNLTDIKYRNSYGQSLYARKGFDGNKEREFLKEHGILKNKDMYYANVYEAFQSNNINELAQKIGLIK